jgi:hypothetical protein
MMNREKTGRNIRLIGRLIGRKMLGSGLVRTYGMMIIQSAR